LKRIEKIAKVLREFYSRRKGAVHFSTPFEVLISCVLSQRTREENTEKASLQLFSKAKTPEEILKLDIKTLEELIKPAGFYREKAKKIKEISRILIEKYDGKVPESREELMKLPGVGYKTSAVVLSYGLGKPIIAVDTHVNRISKRLGLVSANADVEEVRKELEKLFPRKWWKYVNLGCVNFGREVCKPLSPRCDICALKDVCKFYKEKMKNK
jgi:endonuclease-3